MTGIHQVPAPTRIARATTNDIIVYLGDDSNNAQIDATKILLAQGGSLLSTWRLAADLTKMDAAKVAGDLAVAQMQTNVLAAIIAAGGIVNADVANAAAIAKSKISTTGTWVPSDLSAPHHRKMFFAYASGAQSLPTGVTTKLIFDVEEFDLDSVFASNRYTPAQVGYYLVGGGTTLASCTDGGRLSIPLWKNGAQARVFGISYPGAAAVNPGVYGSTLIYLSNVTDYLELYAYNGSSIDENSVPGAAYTYFWGFEI